MISHLGLVGWAEAEWSSSVPGPKMLCRVGCAAARAAQHPFLLSST